ncbi:hypothetical protein KR50_12610 [Jeotgalibacillus campisalis]|uniref:Uncharacterized protein n=1 Tax=Jeotgalibacillus campisalis TaxID=220754 RepID=A0A0C2VW89_9BACL|nr:hypothetical protein KR50_12610 [Jeotgalibacillus campisalis]
MENRNKEVNHADSPEYIYKGQAKDIIFKEKLEICFENLFSRH